MYSGHSLYKHNKQPHTLYTQVETHCGVGDRKWRGVSSYQVKDDLHEWDTHACSLEWNICLVSLFVCVSLGEKIQ